MSAAVISRLVVKDFLLWRRLILVFCGASLACIALLAMLHDRIPHLVFMNLGITLIIGPSGTLGIVLLMQTNVFEKAKSTQPFIMSLPVTVTDFTLAKLLVNIPTFTAAWLVTAGTGFYFAFARGLLPMGAVPFVTMVFVGFFVAYVCILCVSLLCQSLGLTVLAIAFFQLLTPAYLWLVVYLEPVRRVIGGNEVIWNSTSIGVVSLQVLIAFLAVGATLLMQSRKRDFI